MKDHNLKKFRYPGSRPFTQEEGRQFFGREKDREELYKYIQVEKLVVLYAKSGLGKTSLIEAGLLPRLRVEEEILPISVRLGSYLPDQPRSPLQIFQQKTAALFTLAQQEPHLNRIQSQPISLWQFFKRLQLLWQSNQGLNQTQARDLFGAELIPEYHPNKIILLVFDQFEELFTYPDAQVQDFSAQLAELLNRRVPRAFRQALNDYLEDEPSGIAPKLLDQIEAPLLVKILIAIRADRYSLLNRLARHIPDITRNFYELKALNRMQAYQAIVEPAQLESSHFIVPPFEYDPTTIERMLDYLSQRGEKEIESFQLQILCQHAEQQLVRSLNM